MNSHIFFDRVNPHSLETKSWVPELAVIVTITAVSLLVTLPLIFNLWNSVLGGHGDNLYFLWELWWFKRALLDLHVSPFIDYELYFPVGLELARDEITPANTILGLPLTAGLGPAAAYNLLALSSFILSGYAAYRFVFEATNHRIAGLLSGLVFAIMPYRLAHLAGHLNLLPTQWLVLSLVFLERFFRSRRLADGAMAGLFFCAERARRVGLSFHRCYRNRRLCRHSMVALARGDARSSIAVWRWVVYPSRCFAHRSICVALYRTASTG